MVVVTMKMATSENKDSSHWHTTHGWIGHSNYKIVNEEVTQVNSSQTAVT